ncbi:MAG TPA: 6-phosphogluconolactonase [Bacteroidales bacterium]|nr:6-phosphogluconolactonase [Bacteroidales bacterium]
MEPEIRIFEQSDELLRFFSDMLPEKIREKQEGRYFTIALSGGRTPQILFDYLSTQYKDRIDWSRLLVFWGDERCVPPESAESNYRMAREFLLDRVPIPPDQVFRIHGEANPAAEARRYESVVREKVTDRKNGFPVMDLILLGLGEDGHTASIFPDQIGIVDSENLFDTAVNPYSGQIRITATGKLLNHAHVVVFLVIGKAKAEMVSRILDPKEDNQRLPASRVRPVHGELIWLLDSEAAGK